MRTRRGTTITEILGLVAVATVTLGAVTASVTGGIDPVMVQQAQAEAGRIARKAKAHELRTGAMPKRVADLYPVSPEPLDPWGHPYELRRTPDIRIASLGADNTPGGTGAAADIEVTLRDAIE